MLESAAMSKPDSLCRLAAALAIMTAAACRAERPAVPAAGETRRVSQTSQAASPGQAPPPDTAAPYAYYPKIPVDRAVPVAMRDGVPLGADVYRPGAPGGFPA